MSWDNNNLVPNYRPTCVPNHAFNAIRIKAYTASREMAKIWYVSKKEIKILYFEALLWNFYHFAILWNETLCILGTFELMQFSDIYILEALIEYPATQKRPMKSSGYVNISKGFPGSGYVGSIEKSGIMQV